MKRLPVSRLETVRPEILKETLADTDDSFAARFLFAWPGPQPYRPLSDLKLPDNEAALSMLRRLSRLARTPDDPLELPVDERGLKAFEAILANLHAERRRAEGLEAAWLGKGPATIARLAGAL